MARYILLGPVNSESLSCLCPEKVNVRKEEEVKFIPFRAGELGVVSSSSSSYSTMDRGNIQISSEYQTRTAANFKWILRWSVLRHTRPWAGWKPLKFVHAGFPSSFILGVTARNNAQRNSTANPQEEKVFLFFSGASSSMPTHLRPWKLFWVHFPKEDLSSFQILK